MKIVPLDAKIFYTMIDPWPWNVKPLVYICRMAFRQSISYWKEKLGHTTIDLGIAPKKLESYHNGDIKRSDPMDRLKSVKGHLVSFPLDFMCKEDLRPVFNESEYYASPQVFHWDHTSILDREFYSVITLHEEYFIATFNPFHLIWVYEKELKMFV